jgi:hypothetical protein
VIFARLLVGWLDAHAASDAPDLILANPTYTDAAADEPGHIERIIAAASIEDYEGRWAFDTSSPAAIVKTKPTGRSARQNAAGSGPTPQPRVELWPSPIQPVRMGTTFSSSTTSVPQAGSSTPSLIAC